MPQALTLIRTDPAPGSGIGRSTISKGPFGWETCATRITAILPPSVVRLAGRTAGSWHAVAGAELGSGAPYANAAIASCRSRHLTPVIRMGKVPAAVRVPPAAFSLPEFP